ncbi:DUF4355 domain-containing protein [Alkalihalobacillus trypoxylicola]|uniref:DUF4355 domain-containing protein n=1 Tax=Alkalihalobacillus trypoxylicola TaxID=519424 RepID=A0A161PKU9_9BACI|nr:DUF4355 domain-containing protein [Alkalihalobacillus trypoxylicola]KYG34916.1 hypothetical protein AZF04_00865 [Alkalihalobacillus trypoxylicola]
MPEENNIVDEELKNKEDELAEKKQDEVKTFTQEELEKVVQSRLARAEKDKAKAIEEAEKLAKMNADEKQKYEFEKLQRENEELKAAQNKYSLGREAAKMLADSNIIADDEILSLVVREDAEATKVAVSAFSSLVARIVDAQILEKMKGKSPKKQTETPVTLTKEDFNKLSYIERDELYKKDYDTYKKLTN